MMEAVSASETSVNLYDTTRRNIPEGCHLHRLIALLMEAVSTSETLVNFCEGVISHKAVIFILATVRT
jgi:hypothetical protein